jgi:hypothetical protein
MERVRTVLDAVKFPVVVHHHYGSFDRFGCARAELLWEQWHGLTYVRLQPAYYFSLLATAQLGTAVLLQDPTQQQQQGQDTEAGQQRLGAEQEQVQGDSEQGDSDWPAYLLHQREQLERQALASCATGVARQDA